MMFMFIWLHMFIHVYLANVEGIAPSLLMFFHKRKHGGLVYPDIHNIIGEDDLGHGGSTGSFWSAKARPSVCAAGPFFVLRGFDLMQEIHGWD